MDSDDDNNELDVAELTERHGELGEVLRALCRVDERLQERLYETHGLAFLNSHFRAALQKTLNMHRQRHKEYTDVMKRLTEYQSHVDQRRRDLGYESEHHG